MKSDILVNEIYDEIKNKIKNTTQKKLSVILIGDDKSSEIYVNIKRNRATELGIEFDLHRFTNEEITQNEVLKLVDTLNKDETVTGILVQFPLDDKFNEFEIVNSILPSKDIDRVHPYNVGLTQWDKANSSACTADGIIKLLKFYGVELKSKNVVVIGDSMIVGRPVSSLLLNEGATVSTLHKDTPDIKVFTLNADIIISATGVKHLINDSHIKKGAILVDVGVTKENGKIYGDIDIDSVMGKALMVTPPTGAVGPLTVASLLFNIL